MREAAAEPTRTNSPAPPPASWPRKAPSGPGRGGAGRGAAASLPEARASGARASGVRVRRVRVRRACACLPAPPRAGRPLPGYLMSCRLSARVSAFARRSAAMAWGCQPKPRRRAETSPRGLGLQGPAPGPTLPGSGFGARVRTRASAPRRPRGGGSCLRLPTAPGSLPAPGSCTGSRARVPGRAAGLPPQAPAASLPGDGPGPPRPRPRRPAEARSCRRPCSGRTRSLSRLPRASDGTNSETWHPTRGPVRGSGRSRAQAFSAPGRAGGEPRVPSGAGQGDPRAPDLQGTVVPVGIQAG